MDETTDVADCRDQFANWSRNDTPAERFFNPCREAAYLNSSLLAPNSSLKETKGGCEICSRPGSFCIYPKTLSKNPAAMAEPMTPATLGPMACIRR